MHGMPAGDTDPDKAGGGTADVADFGSTGLCRLLAGMLPHTLLHPRVPGHRTLVPQL